jgi:hypothetical protein
MSKKFEKVNSILNRTWLDFNERFSALMLSTNWRPYKWNKKGKINVLSLVVEMIRIQWIT